MLEIVMDGVSSNLFLSVAIIIILATFFAYIARFFKQPLIPAYILAGVLLGPIGFGLIKNIDIITTLSEIGIAFLLFIVGLEIDLKKLVRVGYISIFGGILQSVITFFAGFFVFSYLGFNNIVSIYAGLIVAFSSTMVVVKLLSDGGEIDTLHGRIILGFLLIQDLLVVLVLSVLGTFNSFNNSILIFSLVKGLLLLGISIVISRYVLPGLFRFAAKSDELLFLSAVATSFLFSYLAIIFGFSIAIGAFIAGVGLASLHYSYDIVGKIVPLKDFFATIFFVSLGMQLVMISKDFVKPLVILFFLIVLFKPLVIMILVSLFGYEKRTGYLTSVSLGQVSEFGLILVSGGLLFGHITQEFFSLTVVLVVLTIVLTSYIFKVEYFVYRKTSRFLNVFEKLSVKKKKLEYMPKGVKKRLVLLGSHRVGDVLLKNYKGSKRRILVVDHNPEVIRGMIKNKIPCIYGNITNLEVLKRVKFKDVKLIVSTIFDDNANMFLVKYVKKRYPKVMVLVTARYLHDALSLYEAGADYVILPHIMGGERVSVIIERLINNKRSLVGIRSKHIKYLLNLEVFGK